MAAQETHRLCNSLQDGRRFRMMQIQGVLCGKCSY
jgi:hypothetical protein